MAQDVPERAAPTTVVPVPEEGEGGAISAGSAGATEGAAKPSAGTTVAPEDEELAYTVRPSDSPGSIAELFHIPVSELLRFNHLREDVVLRIGQALRIPNPYASQIRTFKTQVVKLNGELDDARQKLATAQNGARGVREQLESLSTRDRALQHEVRGMPRWRALAMTNGVAALLMLGVAALAMLDWLLMRRRFRTVVETNEALRRLDNKYRSTVAKAELRFQQLYGRRRQGVLDGQEPARIPEDFEIQGLNEELKEALEKQLERMGVARRDGPRRSRLRFLLGGAPVAARPSRR